MTEKFSRGIAPARSLRPFVAAGAGYLGLTVAALWALVARFTTAIPGVAGQFYDYAQYYWNIWWFQHSLFQLGRDPYFTNYILFPHTVNLAYHTFAPLMDAVVLPIYAVAGLASAVNAWIVGALVFDGVAMFAYLRHQRVANGLAFVSGALFALSPAVLSRVSFVHLNLVTIGWLPLSLLAWDYLMERRTWKNALVLALVVYAALLTDLQYIVWLAAVLPLYAVFTLRRVERHHWRRIIGLTLAALLLFGALSWVAPLRQFVAGAREDYGQEFFGIVEDWYSLHLEDIVSWPLRYLTNERATLGILLPVLIVIGLISGRGVKGRWFWLAVGLGFLILALGPTLKPIGLPLPYRLVHELAGGSYRVPARFLLPALFALLVFVSLSLQPVYARLKKPGRWAVVIGGLWLLAWEGHWLEPYPVFNAPDYAIYHQIGAEPGDYLILEVPVGPHNSLEGIFGSGGMLQYYAPVHHKRLINGAVSRAPAGLTEAYRQWPLIAALAEEGPMPDLSVARAELARLGDEWNIQYALIHRDMLEAETATFAAGLLNTQASWCFVGEEGAIMIYTRVGHAACATPDRLNLPSDGKIDLGDDHERYLGPGWYYTENIGGPSARWMGREVTTTLQMNLPLQDYRVTLSATTIVPDQVVTVYVNNQRVAALPIGNGWNDYTFDLPASVLTADAPTTIEFVPTQRLSPQELTQGQSGDERPLAVAMTAIQFEPREKE